MNTSGSPLSPNLSLRLSIPLPTIKSKKLRFWIVKAISFESLNSSFKEMINFFNGVTLWITHSAGWMILFGLIMQSRSYVDLMMLTDARFNVGLSCIKFQIHKDSINRKIISRSLANFLSPWYFSLLCKKSFSSWLFRTASFQNKRSKSRCTNSDDNLFWTIIYINSELFNNKWYLIKNINPCIFINYK